MDEYEHGVFVVVPMLKVTSGQHSDVISAALGLTIETECVSIFVVDAEQTIVTIQEKPGDCWHALRSQLQQSWSKVRSRVSKVYGTL